MFVCFLLFESYVWFDLCFFIVGFGLGFVTFVVIYCCWYVDVVGGMLFNCFGRYYFLSWVWFLRFLIMVVVVFVLLIL